MEKLTGSSLTVNSKHGTTNHHAVASVAVSLPLSEPKSKISSSPLATTLSESKVIPKPSPLVNSTTGITPTALPERNAQLTTSPHQKNETSLKKTTCSVPGPENSQPSVIKFAQSTAGGSSIPTNTPTIMSTIPSVTNCVRQTPKVIKTNPVRDTTKHKPQSQPEPEPFIHSDESTSRTWSQVLRCSGMNHRIQYVHDHAVEVHGRKQLNVLIKQCGFDLHTLQRLVAGYKRHEEGRRRKSGSGSCVGTGYTYGEDDGGNVKNLPTGTVASSSTHPPKLSTTQVKLNLSTIDVNHLERLASIMALILKNRTKTQTTKPTRTSPSNPEETESSSDGESSDETAPPVHPDPLYNYLPVEDDPKTKWVNDRAELVCMWTWIRDALANVNSQIARQDEIYKHIILSKTPVRFEKVEGTSPGLAEVNLGSSSDLTDAIVKVYNKSQSGGHDCRTYLNSNPYDKLQNKNSESTDEDRVIRIGGGLGKLNINFESTDNEGCVAARCLPLEKIGRRRLYNLGGIRNAAYRGKACCCFGKVELCPLCLNRGTKDKLVDCDRMSGREIVTQLDYCTHENLSLRHETRFDLLVDSSMKLGTWKKSKEQKKKYNFILCQNNKRQANTQQQDLNSETGDDGLGFGSNEKRGRGRPRLLLGKPSSPRLIDLKSRKFGTSSSSSNAARKLARMQRAGGYTGVTGAGGGRRIKPLVMGGQRRQFKKRKHSTSFTAKLKDDDEYGMGDFDPMAELDEDYAAWRTPAAAAGKLKRERTTTTSSDHKRTRRDQDYDIDNIVIPYSIASATRVEKIEYKEIITPSWRNVSLDEEIAKEGEDGSGSDYEDVSEQTIQARHDRSEIEEHKKFAIQPSPFSRRGRRTDSKTESFDTPDAMSPVMMDVNAGGCDSPTGGDDHHNFSLSAADASLALTALKLAQPSTSSRRRTTSSSRREEFVPTSMTMQMSAEYGYYGEEEEGPPPFESREFPLGDEEYEAMLAEMPDDFLSSPSKPDQVPDEPAAPTGDSAAIVDSSLTAQTNSPLSDKDDDSTDREDDPDWEFVEGDT